jgi:hypothetical protein
MVRDFASRKLLAAAFLLLVTPETKRFIRHNPMNDVDLRC